MNGTRSLARLVVQLALEMTQYRQDWDKATTDTAAGAARVEQATKGMDAASGSLKNTLERQATAFGGTAAEAAGYAQSVAAGSGAAMGLAAAAGVAVAAVGALGVAAVKGYQEQKKLNDSLLLTGNYAGLVAGQIDRMALQVADRIGGTVGASRDVLAGLVATGRFTVASLGEVGAAVQLVARYSGQTNAQVLKDFAGMADGVAKWALKTNEAYHFLDTPTLQYVKRLEEQGQKQEAVRVTSEALSKHLGGDMLQNLGLIERAWAAIQREVSGAIQAMKNVGKEPTTQELFEESSRYLAKAREGYGARDPRLNLLQQRDFGLFRRMEREGRAAGDESAQRQADERRNQLAEDWGKILERNRSRQQQMNDELRKAREAAVAAGASQVELAKVEAEIRERYRDKRKPQGEKDEERRTRTLAELSGVQATYLQQLADLNTLRERGNISEERYVQLVTELIAKQPMAKKLMEDMANQTERQAKALSASSKARADYVKEVGDSVEKLEKEIEREIEHAKTIGLSRSAVTALVAEKLEDVAASMEQEALRNHVIDDNQAVYDAVMRQADAYRRLAQAKRQTAQAEASDESMKDAVKQVKEIDDVGRRVFADLASRGEDAFEAIGRSIKAQVADQLYQLIARPFVIRLVASMTGQSPAGLSQALGGGGAAGGMGNLNNLGLIGAGIQAFTGGSVGASGASLTIGNAVGAMGGDGLGAMIAANGGWAGVSAGGGMAAGLGEAAAMYGVEAGMGAAAGAAGGAAAGFAAAIPYIGWAIAIASLLSGSFKGETRSGGTYGWAPGAGTAFKHGPSGGEIGGDQVRQAIDASTANINAMLKQLGSSERLTGFHAGLESSEKGRGGVMAGGLLSNGRTFGESGTGSVYDGTYYEKHSTQSPNSEQAMALFAEDLKQATLQALQAADVPGLLGDYLRSLGDVEYLKGGELEKAVTKVNTALTQRAELEEQIYQMTSTEAEKAARARQQELDAIDETNHGLLFRVRALREEQQAAASLAAVLDQATSAAADAAKVRFDFTAGIRSYIANLRGTDAGLGSRVVQRNNALEDFQQQLSLARAGDRNALGSITSYADRLREAEIGYSASGGQTPQTMGWIMQELQKLPQMMSDEEYLAKVITDGTTATVAVQREVADKIWNGLWGAAGLLAQRFDVLDTTVDGMLTFDEIKAALSPLASDATIQALIATVDINDDGNISKLEAINASVQMAAALEQASAQQITYAVNQSTSAAAAAAQAEANAMQNFLRTVFGNLLGPAPSTGGQSGGGTVPGGFSGVVGGSAPGPAPAPAPAPVPFNPMDWINWGGGFANGGAFSNGVVRRPTVFSMAEMGEEAVMPLTNVRGQLGVHVSQGGNTAVVEKLDQLRDDLQNGVILDAEIGRRVIDTLGRIEQHLAGQGTEALLAGARRAR